MKRVEIVGYAENLTCEETADRLKRAAKCLIEDTKSRFYTKRAPHLAIITDGSDTASRVYLRNKTAVCREAGIYVTTVQTAVDCEWDLRSTLENVLRWKNLDGVIVQMPVGGLNHSAVYQLLDSVLPPSLDVDGLTSFSQARCTALYGESLSYRAFLEETPRSLTTAPIVSEGLVCPCTAGGILAYMQAQTVKDEDLEGNRALIINRSRLIGLPLQTILTKKGMSVTVANSKSANLP